MIFLLALLALIALVVVWYFLRKKPTAYDLLTQVCAANTDDELVFETEEDARAVEITTFKPREFMAAMDSTFGTVRRRHPSEDPYAPRRFTIGPERYEVRYSQPEGKRGHGGIAVHKPRKKILRVELERIA
jgi:hypothetical protein